MRTRLPRVASAAGILIPVALGMQAGDASRPKFDVISVKLCGADDGQRLGGDNSSPGRLSMGCMPLADENGIGLIQGAYVRFAGGHANAFQVVPIKGGPEWVRTERYRIDARADGNPSMPMMRGPMLQTLLEDRFKLKIHREVKEGPVYDMTVGKSGRLKAFAEGSCVAMPLGPPIPPPPAGKRYCRALVGPGKVVAEGSTLGEFAKLLNLLLDRPVIDKTGLSGSYEIQVQFTPDDSTPGVRGMLTAAKGGDVPTIFVAVQEQLGLKLVPGRGPNESLVIDGVQRPDGN